MAVAGWGWEEPVYLPGEDTADGDRLALANSQQVEIGKFVQIDRWQGMGQIRQTCVLRLRAEFSREGRVNNEPRELGWVPGPWGWVAQQRQAHGQPVEGRCCVAKVGGIAGEIVYGC